MKLRIIPVIRKEMIHIIRDPRSLAIIFMMPILMILLFGYAITFDVKNIKIAVLDQDHSAASREMVNMFTTNSYFKIVSFLDNREPIYDMMMRRDISAAIVIPKGYEGDLQTDPQISIQVLVDGTNANTATIISNYITAAINTLNQNTNAGVISTPISVEPRIWYNPDLKSSHFIVPGLLAVLMMMICAMLTSITIAREKETGTMEQIIVSPIKPAEIIFGKVVPYILVAFMVAFAVVAFSRIVFGVPFRGSVWVLVFFSFVFIYASLSLGVFISSRVNTQQVALMLSLVGTLLPSILLSGFIFPVFAMPVVLRVLSHIVPATYYLIIARGVMLKGLGFGLLYHQAVFLFIYGTVLLMVSARGFKTHLEG